MSRLVLDTNCIIQIVSPPAVITKTNNYKNERYSSKNTSHAPHAPVHFVGDSPNLRQCEHCRSLIRVLHSAGRARNAVVWHRERIVFLRWLPHYSAQHQCRQSCGQHTCALHSYAPQHSLYGYRAWTACLRHTQGMLQPTA